jgi:molybdate transport system substrate-binding protein
MPASVLLCWALLLSGWASDLSGQSRGPSLTIFAASSLTEVFREMGAAFQQSNPGVTVRFNFAGSQQLAAQIELGGGADLLASADERGMVALGQKSLLSGEPRRFAGNALVVILPAANPGRIQRLQDLARPGLRLVLAAPSVPAGRYSREMIGNLAASEGFPPDFARRALANVVSNEENVRGVLGKVLLGEADGGIVYRTDLPVSAGHRLTLLAIPDEANVTGHYWIAALKQSSHPSLARRFVEYVSSPAGQAILSAHRFLRAPR